AEEVPAAIAEVESAARSGLWAAGFVSYEAAPGLDPSLRVRDAQDGPIPLVWFGLYDGCRDVELPVAGEPTDGPGAWEPSVSRERYDRSIEEIRGHIEAGDTYQVNYTLRLSAPAPMEVDAFYADLCLAQRAAYCASIRTDAFSVLSASPELFFRIDDGRISTRPMKGTAARGRTQAEDEAAAARLSASRKDRAENAMIVDLLRNDLGRIAVPGTVAPDELFATERYDTVWQMTSAIDATLREGTGLLDVFRALFPSGSVTGAPKVRTMELIAELEGAPRGVYTGAVGFVRPSREDRLDSVFNVAIRTVVLDHATGRAEYGGGGGITHDSSAEDEYAECVTKARVLTERRPAFDLLESIRFDPDSGFALLDRHLDRLEASAAYFGFQLDRALVVGELERMAAAMDAPAKVRLTLGRGGEVSLTRDAAPTPGLPVVLVVDDQAVDDADAIRAHKTTFRTPYDRAMERHPEADDVVLVNTRGEVVETSNSNIAVRFGDRWYTPPLRSGCLQGTSRADLLEQGRIEERTILVSELRRADEIAVLNSVRGWRPARFAEEH
ncbi:MAG: aminodeoxychorismate synthase component I, partial [Actinomycetota bacterium]|nr:aminodeoxychorismate synthase component I [Actinomycetota bacterium]